MNKRTDIDRRLSAYFEQPVPELPDRVLDAVRHDIHGTRQRWVLGPWREPDTRALARVLQFATLVVVLLAILAVTVPIFGPGGPPVPTPSFRSPLYGYAVVLPADWTETPATIRWDGESAPSLGPNVDQIAGPHLLVLGYAGPFTGNLAAFVQDRITANARDHSDTCPSNALKLNEPMTIGAEPGVLLGFDCGARIEQAITLRDGIGYAFTIRDAAFATTLDPTDFASIQSMLASVRFPNAPTETP